MVSQMKFMSMFMVYLNKEFEKPTSSALLVHHNKTESLLYIFQSCPVVYILQNYCISTNVFFLKVYYHIKYRGSTVCDSYVIPTSQDFTAITLT